MPQPAAFALVSAAGAFVSAAGALVLAAGALASSACAPSVPRVFLMDAPDAPGPSGGGTGGTAIVRDAARAPPPDGDAPANDAADGGGPIDAPLAGGDAGDGKTPAVHLGGADGGDGGPDDAAFTYDGALPVLPRAGEIVIDELLVNPAGADTNREWIEIANLTALPFDLRGLHVADSAKDVAVDGGLLAPGAILVLGQSADTTKNGGAPVAIAYGGTISLNNAGDTIAICLGPCASGQVLDRVGWDQDLGPAYDGHAAIVGMGMAGLLCAAADPFGSAGSFGTPGARNPPCEQNDASPAD